VWVFTLVGFTHGLSPVRAGWRGPTAAVPRHIVPSARGDYYWTVKDNQPTLLADLELLFSDIEIPAGCGAVPLDFVSHTSVEKGHGRLEERVIPTSSLLEGYTDWPYLAQAVKIERTRSLATKRTHEVGYGITSIPAHTADAARMGVIVRAHCVLFPVLVTPRFTYLVTSVVTLKVIGTRITRLSVATMSVDRWVTKTGNRTPTERSKTACTTAAM
jgi:hypothetical protein